MSLSDLLDAWRADPSVSDNVTAWRVLPARQARTAPLPETLHPALAHALRGQGIEALYTHQGAAWACVQGGGHPVVVTGTASGKTLCYNLPVLDAALRDPEARALYLHPTKALAQDQQDALRRLIAGMGQQASIPAATYDGDTPAAARRVVRQRARVVLSNPDMLHAGVLPHHTQWAEFLHRLRFVVLDEMHVYRGVFGSHLANVLRRLKRVAHFYGAQPQFILTSATIGNPVELAERLIEERVTLVDDDGAGREERHFLVYNPPVIDRDLGLRQSPLQESVRLAQALLEHGVQSIVFARTRRGVEMMVRDLREKERALPPPVQSTGGGSGGRAIRGYRSGYLPRQRREIERGLREGTVRVVVATTALELGVDIGGMDAALLAGYPGTIASTWQQAGRAGRGHAERARAPASLAVLIASASPLEQFLAHHTEYLFGRSPEQALTDPDNALILLGHLRCAAFELPFERGEGFGRVAGTEVAEYLQVLQARGDLHHSQGRTYWMAGGYPAGDLSLRSASPEAVVLRADEGASPATAGPNVLGPTVVGPTVVGQVDRASAYWMVHPGAVYLHEGKTYLVEQLDLERNEAWLHAAEVDYYTQARSETTVQLVEQWDQAPAPGATVNCGEVLVTSQVTGYRKLRWSTQEQLGVEELSLPPTELLTSGYWFVPAQATIDALREQGLWRSDPNQYGPHWNGQRDRARARDRYRCQVCGTAESGHSHHVHHKTPFRAFASAREANRLPNLVTLCPRCHLRVEQAVRMRSGLSGLAYVLGHLAPLYLMCDRRDIGLESDPRSPLAGGQPAVAVFDQVPGGVGFSERLYGLHKELIARAGEWVRACACADGCPSCVGPAGEDGAGGKRETLALLDLLAPERR